MPALRVIHRSSVLEGRELLVDLPVVRLGRDRSCQVLFDEQADRAVSREHAELRWERGKLYVAPLPGKVVLLGGRPVTGPTLLYPGDVVELAGPGGPSVEVQWDGPARPLIGATDLSQVDDAAVTATNLAALDLSTPIPIAALLGQPLPAVVAAPAPKPVPPAPASAALPSDKTMQLPLLSAPDQAPTQFLKPTAFAATPAKRSWLRPALVGAGVLLVAGVALGGAWAYQRSVHRREAIARIERLKAALASRQKPPAVSDDDWKIYEEEYGAQPRPEPPVSPAGAPPAPATTKKPAVDDARKKGERRRRDEALGKERSAAGEAFAAWKRLELERLDLGRHKPPALLIARRKAALAAYEALATPLEAEVKGTDAIILEAARHLGECDAAMPPKLLAGARAAIARFRHDPAEHARLVSTLQRAKLHRYGPTITAALGDQLVPLELFFVPFEQSGFQAQKVGFITPFGYPKGMWQLGPAVARKYGLRLGREAQLPSYDASDERQRYEREARGAAKLMRALYAGPAAGSALLLIASYDHGDDGRLRAMKEKAGLSPSDRDPARVNVWRLYAKGALDDAARKAALTALAEVSIAAHPAAFGFTFPPPLEHVALADGE